VGGVRLKREEEKSKVILFKAALSLRYFQMEKKFFIHCLVIRKLGIVRSKQCRYVVNL
jgi:hypothetical protein